MGIFITCIAACVALFFALRVTLLLSARYVTRCAAQLSVHASDKAFTAPKLDRMAIEQVLGPGKGFRVISAFESPVLDEIAVRPESVGSIFFHPKPLVCG